MHRHMFIRVVTRYRTSRRLPDPMLLTSFTSIVVAPDCFAFDDDEEDDERPREDRLRELPELRDDDFGGIECQLRSQMSLIFTRRPVVNRLSSSLISHLLLARCLF